MWLLIGRIMNVVSSIFRYPSLIQFFDQYDRNHRRHRANTRLTGLVLCGIRSNQDRCEELLVHRTYLGERIQITGPAIPADSGRNQLRSANAQHSGRLAHLPDAAGLVSLLPGKV